MTAQDTAASPAAPSRARHPLWLALCLLVILAPYLYYAWFVWRHLVPIEYADSITYLWRDAFNVHYLTNRSLTQRVLFTLLGNHPVRIMDAQLLVFPMLGVALFLLFGRPGRPLLDLVLALGIAFLLSSYTFNLSAAAIASEPLFLGLLLLFPCVLFLERGRLGLAALILTGFAFIFSRNLAPYALLVLLAVRLVGVRSWPDRRRAVVYAGLALTALASLAITVRSDTSLTVNLVNNVYQRILTDPEATARFQSRDGMPEGPYVEACRDRYVLDWCLGRPILFVNQRTRNYDLMEDEQGFVRWLKSRGRRAYTAYLLWDDPLRTHETLRRDYAELMSGDAIRFVIRYLGKERTSNVPNNRVTIEGTGPGRDVGFLGFDSLALLRDALLPLGLARLHSMLLFVALGLVLSRLLGAPSQLPLATGMLGAGLVCFFLSDFGDAVEIDRHVFPSLVLLVVGTLIFWLSLLAVLIRELRRALGRRARDAAERPTAP